MIRDDNKVDLFIYVSRFVLNGIDLKFFLKSDIRFEMGLR